MNKWFPGMAVSCLQLKAEQQLRAGYLMLQGFCCKTNVTVVLVPVSDPMPGLPQDPACLGKPGSQPRGCSVPDPANTLRILVFFHQLELMPTKVSMGPAELLLFPNERYLNT